ncbi:hypothetical protein HXX76_012927 [Chlamydomonas incerta]|uniref:V-SNARE coiled-coil homology domain-containing protein n=1 Tax=Chlamydomonas incerta TaxID=51695 RepID=A0A835VRK4_CHLIN|nr:hypothetical protein HXX76_012927 [Chlamydomonas incerta]|eukprot:KAG2426612.1 hypothetical protein HXX76_012927 [Chlamydomonas incerta]
MRTQTAKNAQEARPAKQEPRLEAGTNTAKKFVRKFIRSATKLRRRLHRKLKKVLAKPAKPLPAAPPAAPPAIPPLPPPACEEDRLALVTTRVEEVREMQLRVIDEFLSRGENLETLTLQAEVLMQASQDFEKRSVKLLKSNKWWDRLKRGAAVAAGVIAAAVAAVCVARRAVRGSLAGGPSAPIRRSRYSRMAY